MLDSNTIVYLRGDSLSDISPSPSTVTNHSLVINTTDGMFKPYCIEINSTNYANITNPAVISGDYTIEYWCKYISLSTSYTESTSSPVGGDNIVSIAVDNQSGQSVGVLNPGKWWGWTENPPSFDLFTWNHYCLTRHNGIVYANINGIQRGSTAFSDDLIVSSVLIGRQLEQSYVADYHAYVCHIRISDVCRYNCQAVFPVPSEPFYSGGYPNSCLLNLHGNSFNDVSDGESIPEIEGNITISDGKFKKSLVFNGNSDNYIAVPSSHIFNTANVTIDFWINLQGVVASAGIFSSATTGDNWNYINGAVQVSFNASTQKLKFRFSTSAPSTIVDVQTVSDIPLSQWAHVACVKNGEDVYIFINGIQDVTQNIPSILPVSCQGNMYIGKYDEQVDFGGLDAMISEFRISNYAIWTSNFPIPQRKDYYPEDQLPGLPTKFTPLGRGILL